MAWPKGKKHPNAFGKNAGTESPPKIEADKLNLGSGPNLKEGYCNIDKGDFADLQIDLEDATLPFSDNSISEIVADQLFEHIHNFIPLMNECQRVLKPYGKLIITVPQVPYLEAFQDPTHVRFFTDRSFNYFHSEDYLWTGVGKTYGIEPFRHMVQTNQQWQLKVSLVK